MRSTQRSNLLIAVVLQLCVFTMAQAASARHPSRNHGLQLSLTRFDIENQSEQEAILRIGFFNSGTETVVLPTPTVLCNDSMGGFVTVYKEAVSSKSPEHGSGCFVDRVAREDVLAEAGTWKVLAPGETYEVRVPLAKLLLNRDSRYKLYAKYYPAHFKEEELKTLVQHGIHVVLETAESDPIIIEPQETER